MDEPKEALSYARLVSRQKYYKEKALKLEKDFIFTKEQLTQVEQQLQETKIQAADHDKIQKELEALSNAYGQLKEKYDRETQENQTQLQGLQVKIETLQKSQRSEDDVDNETYQQRVKGFERLLGEVQQEINEKEKEIAVYKRRLLTLEKRLKATGEPQLSEEPNLSESNNVTRPSYRAITYSDYAIILEEKRHIIRGDFVIENVGEEPLSTPMLCFRFNPGDTAVLKGRVYHIDDALAREGDIDGVCWVFLDNDWAKESKERGEIWVHPLNKVSVDPGESLRLNDFQVPVENQFYNHLSIEVFVYFQDIDYKVKAANQILINV
ncbi:hypothetical protein EV207_16216 [Scopulibacillus darangshiensis]|uniref:Uncharacterized protein n=1 Tax=Scopulibacillus darangshiensis TaxID=442528 RepID=A0A4R2NE28_9BACL|nr:hypothetical protein [Scopulibacillus darangshiensis]TCP19511.1 hypothetical protein EV207_16216 [Scopulibacillus darangshiensis]